MGGLILLLIFFETSQLAHGKGIPGSLYTQKKEIIELGSKLSDLEKELGKKNNLYIQSLERIEKLSKDQQDYLDKLEVSKAHYEKKSLEKRQIIRSYALSLIDEDVLFEETYEKLIKDNEEKTNNILKEIAFVQKILGDYDTRLINLKKDEIELEKITMELSLKKDQLLELYQKKISNKNLLEKKWDKNQIYSQVAESKKLRPLGEDLPSLELKLPFKEFREIKSSEKGVTFLLGQQQAIYAPYAGRVAYNGDLSSYGKVIMIDHGKDIRTVLLGQFDSSLKKNDLVELGQQIGITEKGAESFYFEVRKKNLAQKTIFWIDENSKSNLL